MKAVCESSGLPRPTGWRGILLPVSAIWVAQGLGFKLKLPLLDQSRTYLYRPTVT